jgi:hypothetical protein
MTRRWKTDAERRDACRPDANSILQVANASLGMPSDTRLAKRHRASQTQNSVSSEQYQDALRQDAGIPMSSVATQLIVNFSSPTLTLPEPK